MSLSRHGRACPGHPRLDLLAGHKDVDARDKRGRDGLWRVLFPSPLEGEGRGRPATLASRGPRGGGSVSELKKLPPSRPRCARPTSPSRGEVTIGLVVSFAQTGKIAR